MSTRATVMTRPGGIGEAGAVVVAVASQTKHSQESGSSSPSMAPNSPVVVTLDGAQH